MDKETLLPYVEMLNKAEKSERAAIVKELAEANNLKEREVWKLLREAGFDPQAGQQTNQQADQQTEQKSGSKKKLSVVLRHKTEYPRYRRAGLVLTQKAETYEVTEEQLAALKSDSWVVIGEDKKEDE